MKAERSILFAVLLIACSVSGEVRAEYRTWTASSGGYTTEAEFVELTAANAVKMKLKSGEVRDVPLDRLSAADQAYVRGRMSGAKSERRLRVETEAERCRSARDMLRIYKVFVDGAEATDADRAALVPRIAELEPLAEKNLFRVGGKWITQEETAAIRKRANELMKQGFEVLKLNQEDTFRKKFAEAAALEPEEVRADFMLGVIYSSSKGSRNIARAVQHYETCLKRDPVNTAVMNNLAVLKLKNADYRGALDLWKAAMTIVPDQRICHNIGKLVKLSGVGAVTLPKPILDQLTDLYISNIGEGKLKPTDGARGWLHLLIDDASLDLDLDQSTQAAAVVPPPSAEGPVVGGGTGFVVASNYIVTNHHVVDGGSTFEIQTADGSREQTLQATVVATSKSPDLALLKCEALSAPAVSFDAAPCRRGTDVMVLGYPEMFELGATLKATRGVISGLPSPALDNLYLYDAVTNGGNSGGPVCDVRGNVVAVHCIGVNTASRYGGGIPAAEVVAFLKKSLPGYSGAAASTQTLDWPAVDQRVSPATVLVWVRKREATATTSISGALEDCSCLKCTGFGGTKCLNGGCINGAMTVRVRGTSVKTTCPICLGTGISQCTGCLGTGVDRVVLATAAKKASDAPATSGPVALPDSTPSYDHSPLYASVIEVIQAAMDEGRLEDYDSFAVSGGKPFRDVVAQPGILIGLDVTYRKVGTVHEVGAIRPIYLTREGKSVGPWHGTPEGTEYHVEAKPGFAVERIGITKDTGVSSLTLRFSPFSNGGYGGAGSYSSSDYGNGKNRISVSVPQVSTRGGFIVGLHGGTFGSTPDYLAGLSVVRVKVPESTTTTAPRPVPTRPTKKTPAAALVNKYPTAVAPNDRESRHPPLPAELAAYLKEAIAEKKAIDVGSASGNDVGFRVVPPEGGLLIGFDITYGQFINTPLVHAFRPIFLTAKGKVQGPPCGVGGKGGSHIEAKPGYAVGRMYCKDGLYLNTITITFMKITPTGLDPKDSYEGLCYGGAGGSGREMIGDDGQMIVGVFGQADAGNGGLKSLSGVVVDPMP